MSQIPIVVQHAPRFTPGQAEGLAADRYRRAGRATALPSERDQNFRIRCEGGTEFVLKIANTTEREEILEFQNAALAHLGAARVGVPEVVPDVNGAAIGLVDGHMVRMLTWVPGRALAETRPHSRDLLVSLGRALGGVDRAFEGFSHPAMRRPLQWDLARTSWIAAELGRFADPARRALVERVVERFEQHASPRLAHLRRQVIHNDWNDYNVLVREGAVVAAVDFGDMLESWTVADLAVACAYAMLDKPDPVAAAAAIVAGYHDRLPLLAGELEVLLDLVRARLAISVTMAACQSAEAPDNDYLHISERCAWDLLAALDATDPAWALCAFRHACGLPASPRSAALRHWLRAHRADVGPVVDDDLRTAPLAVLDLSVGSLDIPNLAVVENLESFCALVERQIAAAAPPAARAVDGAGVISSSRPVPGIGRYDEARLVYVSDLFRHAGNWDVENRTVHIGIDIFLPAGSVVRAPLDAVVHSVRNNQGAGDYGPTIILEHVGAGLASARAVASGQSPADHTVTPTPFYTLYGHLSEDSIAGLRAGDRVRKGDVIAHLGDTAVNGGWPPHLHFQIIADMLGHNGDFPGVAAPSERAIWLDLCPDPNLILGIPEDRFPALPPAPDEILASRRHHLGRNLSVSYRRPLTMVRGHMQYLFDADGRRFLDAVNNVPHVGHGHPRVVAAAARQLAVLNTNTRYLHPVLASYAARLAALMPDPLSVCYIVCSGSEANELALRLASAYTGRRLNKAVREPAGRQTALPHPAPPSRPGVIVVDGAYHGNTTSLVEISPYKFDGPGGNGCAPHVRKALMPDSYRGPYKADDPHAGARYAKSVSAAVREFEAEGRIVSAFFCESLLSCGGQVVLPGGYLAAAYEAVRAAGGVCVADEVQVGFGRVGSHFWGFETQGVVPDIVTLGKPIGNGYPLAAVVTRPDIAAAFDNGMEYFNTFGGSQASCAVGHAVLDIMRDEALQERAASVGAHLKSGLERLKDRFPLVGDVRGLGLFLGVELVADRTTLAPAAGQADYIVNRLRDRGVLVSTDGPLHNVLKIKPPLQFSDADADRLVSELAGILQEDEAQP